MKAIVYREYGQPRDVLSIRNIDRPVIGADEVLVHVRGASVNPADIAFVTGQPGFMRAMVGLRGPRHPVPGRDYAGVVEEVGAEVTGLKAGDEVYGEASRTFAEYARVRPGQASRKPANLTFEQSAAVPLAGVTAWQGLQKAPISGGTRVLVNGASGGVGHYALQIAKAAGAEVTAVCSGRNTDMVAGLGADHVIDYTQTDYTEAGLKYDVIFDAVRSHRLGDVRRALAEEGTYLAVGAAPGGGPGDPGLLGGLPQIAGTALRGLWTRPQHIVTVAARSNGGIEQLTGLIESGKVTPFIDQTYPLAGVPEALTQSATHRVRGKIAISV